MCEDLHVHEFYAASTEEKQFAFMQINFKKICVSYKNCEKLQKKLLKENSEQAGRKKRKKQH